MTSILGTGDSCATTAGSGFVTTWTLAGNTAAYTGSLSTDGYKLKAAMTFKNGGTTIISPNTAITASAVIGIGSCVATLDSAGSVPVATDVTVGNFAICHFVFYAATATTAVASGTITNAYTGTHWGVTKYLTATQWGSTTPGSGIIGSTMNTTGAGTAITTASWGVVFSPSTATTAFTEAAVYSMEWYQPSYKTAYTASELRRYGGGYNNSTADKVKGYCVSQRLISVVTNVSAGIVAGTTVTLSGAEALAAGAIAFGVAALAI